jgi:ribonuclease HI
MKYYIVWKGVKPGIYDKWSDCERQVKGFPGAKYKSFVCSQQEAEKRFKEGHETHVKKSFHDDDKVKNKNHSSGAAELGTADIPNQTTIIPRSIAVDAACSGNPGKMEYRGVNVENKEVVFKQGPFEMGTNNIGEFLAIVHALAYLQKHNNAMPVYTDSVTAIAWIKNKKSNSNLKKTPENETIFDLIQRAEKWLEENNYPNQILKWNTRRWGEIVADYARKK